MSPNSNPPGDPPPQMPKNPTLIFDYRDAPLDPEELAAIQSMKNSAVSPPSRLAVVKTTPIPRPP